MSSASKPGSSNGKTLPTKTSASLLLSAILCFSCLTTDVWGQATFLSTTSAEGPEHSKIDITDAFVESPERPIRRGSVTFKVDEGMNVYLQAIKCADGSIATIYFPPSRTHDGRHYGELSGLQQNGVEILAPGLDLMPGAAFNLSNPVPGHPDYVDIGHLIFTGGSHQSRMSRGDTLSCLMLFRDHVPVRVEFKWVGSIEDLHNF